MARLKLQPREFRLRAGARTDLDRSFLQIIAALPADANLSEFIKTQVVEGYQRRHHLSDGELLQEELLEIRAQLRDFCLKLRVIEEKQAEGERIQQIKADLQALLAEMNHAFPQ